MVEYVPTEAERLANERAAEWRRSPEGIAWKEEYDRKNAEKEQELRRKFAGAQWAVEPPAGVDPKSAPPSGFVDEPDVYEEAHVKGQQSEEILLVVDPTATEIMGTMDSPTQEELDSPEFQAVWNVIKSWDVNVPEYYEGYCGANGSHAILITRALRREKVIG